MRILHVETINNVAHGYAVGLARRGHVSTFFEPSLRGGAASRLVKLAHMPGRVWDLRRAIGRINRKERDVVHINWAGYGVAATRARRADSR